MTDDPAIPLCLASDLQLAQELVRRSVASRLHGLMLVYARPQEGAPERLESHVDVIAGSDRVAHDMLAAVKTVVEGRFTGASVPTQAPPEATPAGHRRRLRL
jgi:hypothetical protein